MTTTLPNPDLSVFAETITRAIQDGIAPKTRLKNSP